MQYGHKAMSVKGFITLKTNTIRGSLLVASPNMDDSIFKRAVIILCANDDIGSFGVMISKTEVVFDLKKFAQDHDIKTNFLFNKKAKVPVYVGGPVDQSTLLIVSFDEPVGEITIYNNAERYIEDYLKGLVSSNFLLAKGFCSWGVGQLAAEIVDNSWILIPTPFSEIMKVKPEKRWNTLIKKLNLNNPNGFVNYSGTA
jgi:putative transcriptional regulator